MKKWKKPQEEKDPCSRTDRHAIDVVCTEKTAYAATLIYSISPTLHPVQAVTLTLVVLTDSYSQGFTVQFGGFRQVPIMSSKHAKVT